MKNNYLKIILIILIILSASVEVCRTAEIYAFIKSKELTQMDTVITGFSESFPDANISVLDLEGKRNTNRLIRFIKTQKPAVIICLGSLAANTAIQVEREIPIIFAMVINYKRYSDLQQKNVTGVSMEIPPESLLTQFRMLIPQIRTVGVPYHPSVSSEIVRDAAAASKKIGLELIPIRVTNPNDMKKMLSDNEKKYSGLWMLADTRLYNRRTNALRDLLAFATMRKKAVLAFSEAFLRAGAFFSISIDYRCLGSQLSLISRQIVHDSIPPKQIPVAPPIGTFTAINKNVAMSLLGEELDESIYDEVDKIYPEGE